jgi:hypothetical protein
MGLFGSPTLVLVLRLSGKGTLAKTNAVDLVVTVAFGFTAASRPGRRCCGTVVCYWRTCCEWSG